MMAVRYKRLYTRHCGSAAAGGGDEEPEDFGLSLAQFQAICTEAEGFGAMSKQPNHRRAAGRQLCPRATAVERCLVLFPASRQVQSDTRSRCAGGKGIGLPDGGYLLCRMFDAFDVDGDGLLSLAEMQAMREAVSKAGATGGGGAAAASARILGQQYTAGAHQFWCRTRGLDPDAPGVPCSAIAADYRTAAKSAGRSQLRQDCEALRLQ